MMNGKIGQLVAQMTVEEKALLCTGGGPWTTAPIERLGIKSIVMTDGPHGVRRSVEIHSMISESQPATCFPVAAALAATWDRDLLYEMGQALAEEAVALGVDILLGPGINMKRSPLCGRNFEYFSEDPVAAGELSAALINGIQSKGVGTSLKHFAVNNQETRRFSVDAIVDERTLHEIYLTGFEIAVKKANPWTIMCAYNSLNGSFCSQNHDLLTAILRDQWGYEGFVMSDWGAVRDRTAALAAGLDLEMPGPSPHRTQAVIAAVQSGELPEAVLDRAAERLLNIIFRAQQTPKGSGQFDQDAHHALARRVAAESIVLLKNEGGILPLKDTDRLAIIGRAAAQPAYQGGGSSHVNPTRVDTPLDMLRERVEFQYAAGDSSTEIDRPTLSEAASLAAGADTALLFIALPAAIESEGYDRVDLSLTPQQVRLIKAVAQANPRTVVVLNNGSAIDMREWIDDVPVVVEAWLGGQAGAAAVIDMLFGEVNPCGRLAETFPLRLSDTPAYLNFPGENNSVRYGEGLFIGYRAYDALERDVLFPFGFGLSYTTFAYSGLRISAHEFPLGSTVDVSIDITNTGAVHGKEVVQVYVHDVQSRLRRPPKELKAFAKVLLAPGETKTVTLSLDERAFSYYDPAYHRWVAEAGEFDILVGSSSAHIHASDRVTLTSGTPLPSIINRGSTLGDWTADPAAAQLIKPILEPLEAAFGSGGSAALGTNMQVFFRDVPLTILFSFLGFTDPNPDEMVDGLLKQLYGESA